jgi:hypothetical protein
MKIRILLVLLAGSVALWYYTGLALACPSYLQCANFTASDKKADCNYLIQGLNEVDKQDVLCILWDQSYETNGLYSFNQSSINSTISLPYHEIENTDFILAGKIITLAFLNYIAFSFGKSSFLLKWLTAVS